MKILKTIKIIKFRECFLVGIFITLEFIRYPIMKNGYNHLIIKI